MHIGIPFPGVIISIAVMIFWLWMLTDCASNEPSEGNDKLVWTLIIVLIPLFGSIIYYFIRRPQRIKAVGH